MTDASASNGVVGQIGSVTNTSEMPPLATEWEAIASYLTHINQSRRRS